MVYYLYGDQNTYPNLRLSLWTVVEQLNKTTFGTKRLNGDLELRVKDWIDFEEETGKAFDDRLVEMGWMFKKNITLPDNLSEKEKKELAAKEKYDGIKVRFLYSYDHIFDSRNDIERSPLQKGYTDYFELDDMYSVRLNIKKMEPKDMHVDKQTNWQLERARSKKVCLDRGECVFIAGFSREY